MKMLWKCKQGSFHTDISSLISLKGHFSVVSDLLKKEIPSTVNLSAVYCPLALVEDNEAQLGQIIYWEIQQPH